MKENKLKWIGLLITLAFVTPSMTVGAICNEQQKSQIAELTGPSVHGGDIRIEGPTNDPTVWCSAKNNLDIPVGENGAVVTIYVNYYMDCPGAADDGYVSLEIVGSAEHNSVKTGTHDEGTLEVSKFFYPGKTVVWKLYAKYTDYYGTITLGEDTDYGGGLTNTECIFTLEITAVQEVSIPLP